MSCTIYSSVSLRRKSLKTAFDLRKIEGKRVRMEPRDPTERMWSLIKSNRAVSHVQSNQNSWMCSRVRSGSPTHEWGRRELRRSGRAVRTGRARWAWSTWNGRRLRRTRRWRIWARGSWRRSRPRRNGVSTSFIQFELIRITQDSKKTWR